MVATPQSQRAFTMLELIVSLALILVLLGVLLPALFTARVATYRETCAGNQQELHRGWQLYLEDNDGQFPAVTGHRGWHYGGVRFSPVDAEPFFDPARPLTPYLRMRGSSPGVFRCPADCGIGYEHEFTGTGRRTAFRSFGTSYRANPALFDARRAGLDEVTRGLFRREITTPPSRLVLLGDPVWYEVAEDTGREASWHGEPDAGNMLFLDGSVRFLTVWPRTRPGPVLFDPLVPGAAPTHDDDDD